MKYKYIISIVSLLPLVVVTALAIIGITLDFWVYLILAIVCPLVAGIVWFIYKDTEKKVSKWHEGR